MKHKVSELEGALLDAAVAKALGHRDLQLKNGEWRSRTEDGELSPIAAFSENWAAGGPIIERRQIAICVSSRADRTPTWLASLGDEWDHNGTTALSAAMRCVVASEFGDEVDL